MHPQSSPGGASTAAPLRDRNPQAAYENEQAHVLTELLDEHPALMTYEEARIARVRDPDDTLETDSFELAVRGLRWSGLIRRQGDMLVPTKPAREMYRLGFRLG
jgi:hypothetical protein